MKAHDFHLTRFVVAQEHSYPTALEELRAGRKRSHWIWFVFPQLRGLGHSAMSEDYGLSGLAEARAYLADPLLGQRLRESLHWRVGPTFRKPPFSCGRRTRRRITRCVSLLRAASCRLPGIRRWVLVMPGFRQAGFPSIRIVSCSNVVWVW